MNTRIRPPYVLKSSLEVASIMENFCFIPDTSSDLFLNDLAEESGRFYKKNYDKYGKYDRIREL